MQELYYDSAAPRSADAEFRGSSMQVYGAVLQGQKEASGRVAVGSYAVSGVDEGSQSTAVAVGRVERVKGCRGGIGRRWVPQGADAAIWEVS